MYGDKGPPKGYSVPRYDSGATARHCQHCSSKDHWSYECTSKRETARSTSAAAGAAPKVSVTARLSRTQMLKYGLKRKRTEFVPEPTEREAYDAEMKALQKILTAEVREEVKAAAKDSSEASDPTALDVAASAKRAKSERHSERDTVEVKQEKSLDGNE